MAKQQPAKEVDRRAAFIHQLAVFLVDNQAGKGIELELERRAPKPLPLTNWATEWAQLRSTTPIFGYPIIEEAETQLRKFIIG